MLEIPCGGGLQAIQRKTGWKQGMRLNAIRCLPCKGAGPVTSSGLGKEEGGPGAWGLGPRAAGGWNGEWGAQPLMGGLDRMWTGVMRACM